MDTSTWTPARLVKTALLGGVAAAWTAMPDLVGGVGQRRAARAALVVGGGAVFVAVSRDAAGAPEATEAVATQGGERAGEQAEAGAFSLLERVPKGARPLVGAAIAAVALGSVAVGMAWGQKVDDAAAAFLARRGARRPYVLLGALYGVGTVALEALDT